jgi:hypothetical protein
MNHPFIFMCGVKIKTTQGKVFKNTIFIRELEDVYKLFDLYESMFIDVKSIHYEDVYEPLCLN